MRYLRRRRYVRTSSVGLHRLINHGHNIRTMFKEGPALHRSAVPRNQYGVLCVVRGYGPC